MIGIRLFTGLGKELVIVIVIVAAGCATTSPPSTSTNTSSIPSSTPSSTPSSIPSRTPSPLASSIDSIISAPQFANAHWGILVFHPESSDTLYAHNSAKLFMPASNMKIVTGAVGLTQLGAGYRWRTTFVAGGPVKDGRLEGNLIVSGTGDPTFSDHARKDALAPMREIADSLAARGITSITGRIVTAGDPFPGPKLGAAWSWDYLGEDYGAGWDALYFNEGFARVAVRGIRDSVALTVLPATGYPVVRRGALRVSSDSTLITVALDSVRREFVASGNLRRGTVDTVVIVYPDQRAAWLGALQQPVSALGARRSANPAGAAAIKAGDTLLVYRSPPLGEVLPLMEKPSQNQIAEIIFHTIGLEKAGVGSEDSARAVVMRQLVAWGASPDGFLLKDGSGLSRKDYVSPATLAHVLAAMRGDSTWLAALPQAGVDGSLEFRFRGTPAAGNVRAKTGSIENVRSLSGYLTAADGRRLIFVLLCNNFSVPQSHVDSAQEAIVQLLVAPHK